MSETTETESLRKKLEDITELLEHFALLETENDQLRAENRRVMARNADLENWHQQNMTKIRESEEWRKRFELAVHTEDYKQDAEKAFTRGEIHARTKMKNYLQDFVNSINVTGKIDNE